MPYGLYNVDEYRVRLWSSRSTSNLSPGVSVAGIYFYEGNTFRGRAYFHPDGTQLPDVDVSDNGEIVLHYSLCQFHSIMEMLRVEKPIIIYGTTERRPYGYIETGREPIGEEEGMG